MALDELLERINISEYIEAISKRKDLTWGIIQKYPTLSWPAKALSRLAPLDYITNNMALTWDFYTISFRQDLTIDFIQQFKNQLDWGVISMNVDLQIVLNNPALPWNWKAISFNKKITPDDLIENPQCKWDYAELTSHIDINFIYANPQIKWDYYWLAQRVDLDFLNEFTNSDWNYYKVVSRNPNLTIQHITKDLSKPWNWKEVLCHPNIQLDDILKYNLHRKDFESFQRKYPDYCIEHETPLTILNWDILSEYASIKSISEHPEKEWSKYHLSSNLNINMDFVLEHPALPWDYFVLSKNTSITLQDVLDHWGMPWMLYYVIDSKY